MKYINTQPQKIDNVLLRVRDERAREDSVQYRPPATQMQAAPFVSFTSVLNKKSELQQVTAFDRTKTIFPNQDENVNHTSLVKPISSRYQ